MTLLVIWLSAWLLSLGCGLLANKLYTPASMQNYDLPNISIYSGNVQVQDSSVPFSVRALNIAGSLLGVYVFVGWIPALIVYTKLPKMKRMG